MGMSARYHLYFDDTGSRDPDHNPDPRSDKMNCFALGGVLIKEEDIDAIYALHKEFCSKWKIDYPLHSSPIRGGRGKFSWLKKPENAGIFMAELEEYLLSLPIVCIACVIDRPGYLARYKEQHKEQMWFMCKTAFHILVERSAKFSASNRRQLEVYFEELGRKEDRDIIQYMRELKRTGSYFEEQSSDTYTPLSADDYRAIVLGEPRRKTKKVPMIQIADLVLYPMAKAGYDPTYRPYKRLRDCGKLIDCLIPEIDIQHQGIKYSCFDNSEK